MWSLSLVLVRTASTLIRYCNNSFVLVYMLQTCTNDVKCLIYCTYEQYYMYNILICARVYYICMFALYVCMHYICTLYIRRDDITHPSSWACTCCHYFTVRVTAPVTSTHTINTDDLRYTYTFDTIYTVHEASKCLLLYTNMCIILSVYMSSPR